MVTGNHPIVLGNDLFHLKREVQNITQELAGFAEEDSDLDGALKTELIEALETLVQNTVPRLRGMLKDQCPAHLK